MNVSLWIMRKVYEAMCTIKSKLRRMQTKRKLGIMRKVNAYYGRADLCLTLINQYEHRMDVANEASKVSMRNEQCLKSNELSTKGDAVFKAMEKQDF